MATLIAMSLNMCNTATFIAGYIQDSRKVMEWPLCLVGYLQSLVVVSKIELWMACIPNSNLINNLVFGFELFFYVLAIDDRFKLGLSIVSY